MASAKPTTGKSANGLEPHATLKEAVQGREVTTNNSILGIDINQFKHTLDLFKYSLDYAEAIVNTVREPLVILNKDLKVITANRAFYKTFNIYFSFTAKRRHSFSPNTFQRTI